MKISELVNAMKLVVYSGTGGLNREILGAYTCDLLSDVMGNAQPGQVWITMQGHLNTLAVADLKDMSAIILVGGHQPAPDAVAKSNELQIPVLGTQERAFEISGRLYRMLMEK